MSIRKITTMPVQYCITCERPYFDIPVSCVEVLDREMPFTAKECLKHYLSIGKGDNKLYGGVATKNSVNFIELKEF